MIVEITLLIILVGLPLWYIVVLIRGVNDEFFAFETDGDRIARKEASHAYYATLLALVKIHREELELTVK